MPPLEELEFPLPLFDEVSLVLLSPELVLVPLADVSTVTSCGGSVPMLQITVPVLLNWPQMVLLLILVSTMMSPWILVMAGKSALSEYQ